MTIFEDLNTNKLFFRPFLAPADLSKISEFTEVNINTGIKLSKKISYVKTGPYQFGYEIELKFYANDQSDFFNYWAANNCNFEILIPSSQTGLYYRVGDRNGLQMVEYFFRYDLRCESKFFCTFRTKKPARHIYEKIEYPKNVPDIEDTKRSTTIYNIENGQNKKTAVRRRVAELTSPSVIRS